MKSNVTILIEDALDGADLGAIEVRVMIGNGDAARWCFFMTPRALEVCGDVIESSDVRVHLGVPHMIVVSRIDRDVVHHVIRSMEADGVLHEHTAPIDSPRVSEEEEFLRAVEALRRSRLENPEQWQSDTIEDYLEAALAWASDSDFGATQGIGKSAWSKVTAFLAAGSIYE
jgi:hypothetical protein